MGIKTTDDNNDEHVDEGLHNRLFSILRLKVSMLIRMVKRMRLYEDADKRYIYNISFIRMPTGMGIRIGKERDEVDTIKCTTKEPNVKVEKYF